MPNLPDSNARRRPVPEPHLVWDVVDARAIAEQVVQQAIENAERLRNLEALPPMPALIPALDTWLRRYDDMIDLTQDDEEKEDHIDLTQDDDEKKEDPIDLTQDDDN